MRAEQVNRVIGRVMVALSLVAFLTVLTGYALTPQPDEGTGAHIFQLSIVALVPTIILFLGTADWRQPWRTARPLAVAAVATVLAFAALYYLEHYHYIQHYR